MRASPLQSRKVLEALGSWHYTGTYSSGNRLLEHRYVTQQGLLGPQFFLCAIGRIGSAARGSWDSIEVQFEELPGPCLKAQLRQERLVDCRERGVLQMR
jgi:hypothetical protein